MKLSLSQLRRIIRESLEADEMEESEFTYAIAKAAEKGQKKVDIDGKEFPVKMSKDKAKKITKKQGVLESKCHNKWHDSPVKTDGIMVHNCPSCGEAVPDIFTKKK